MVKKGWIKWWHSWAFSCPSHRLQTVPDGPRCDGDEQKKEKMERVQRRRGWGREEKVGGGGFAHQSLRDACWHGSYRTPFVGRDEVYLKEVFGMRHCVHTRMYSGACVSRLKQRLALSLLKAQDVLCEVGRSACQQKSGEERGAMVNELSLY